MKRKEAVKLLEHISIAYTPTDAYGDYDDPQPYEEALDMAIESLSEKPKGEWLHVEIIDDDDPRGINDDAAECSICGFTHNSHYWASTYYNFCPNCGANMKSEVM